MWYSLHIGVGCWLLFVACSVLRGVYAICLLCFACHCSLLSFVVCCVFIVVRCLLYVVRCCSFVAVSRLLFVSRCLLLFVDYYDVGSFVVVWFC